MQELEKGVEGGNPEVKKGGLGGGYSQDPGQRSSGRNPSGLWEVLSKSSWWPFFFSPIGLSPLLDLEVPTKRTKEEPGPFIQFDRTSIALKY